MEEKDIHIRDYLKIIDKRRSMVITLFSIVFLFVVIKTISSTPIYTASTKVLIEKNDTSPLGNYNLASFDPEFLDTQTQIIRSLSVAMNVVDKLNISQRNNHFLEAQSDVTSTFTEIKAWFSDLFSVLFKILGGVSDEKEKTGADSEIESIAQQITRNISVIPVRNSKIVNISFESTNPQMASMVANTVATAYIEELLEMKMNASSYAIGWMKTKAEEERTRLRNSENALQEYMKANDIVTVENRITIIPQKLTELSRQLTLAETRRKELASLYRRASQLTNHPEEAEMLPMIASNHGFLMIRDQILRTEQEIIDLSKKYGEKHPVMIQAAGELTILKKKKVSEIKRVIRSIKIELEIARSKEADLRKFLAETKQEAVNLNEKFIQYGLLKRDVETNRSIFDALITKVKEQNLTEQMQTVKVWIVDKARTPEFPSAPNKKRNIMLGLVLGLFISIGAAFFIEYLDNTVKSPEDLEERFPVPVLGAVAFLKAKDKHIEDILMKEPNASFSETYKGIRTSVLLSSVDSPPQRILFSSMSPKDGKTTTAANFAISMAHSDKKVLLIDCDLRKPRIHQIFGKENTIGLTTFLAGETNTKIFQYSPVENLSLITSGPVPPNPSELLGSDKFKDFLDAASQNFDFIILDSPPLLAVSDSMILSKTVDGTILVVRAEKTTFDLIGKGLKKITDIESPVTGMVINGVHLKKRSYYNYNYYHGYYQTEENKHNQDKP